MDLNASTSGAAYVHETAPTSKFSIRIIHTGNSLTSPWPCVVVVANVPHPASFAPEVMHSGKSDATPPVLLSDGILPGVAPLPSLEALAVLDGWQIGHI